MDKNLKNGGLPPSAMALKDSLSPKHGTSRDRTMLSSYQRDLLLQGEQEIDEVLQEADETVPFKYSITSYGADYPVDSLIKRVASGDIIVPKFQRGYVWSLKEASRFVESLLLGLPVPSIFLSKETGSEKLLVIDGQQRLLTLRFFHEGIWPATRKEFALKGVPSKFEGQTFKVLAPEDRRRFENAIIHAIIIKQDEPSDDQSGIYHVFERLNTTGVSLTAQEIRAAIYHGPFSELLKELNQASSWRDIYGPINKLMRDQELILRFFALFYKSDEYSRPMKAFLNNFMGSNRHLNRLSRGQLMHAFVPTIDTIHEALGKRTFRLAKAFNAAVYDAVMVGVARRLQNGRIDDYGQLQQRYEQLIKSSDFLLVAERATADEESVSKRLQLATSAFADVG